MAENATTSNNWLDKIFNTGLSALNTVTGARTAQAQQRQQQAQATQATAAAQAAQTGNWLKIGLIVGAALVGVVVLVLVFRD